MHLDSAGAWNLTLWSISGTLHWWGCWQMVSSKQSTTKVKCFEIKSSNKYKALGMLVKRHGLWHKRSFHMLQYVLHTRITFFRIFLLQWWSESGCLVFLYHSHWSARPSVYYTVWLRDLILIVQVSPLSVPFQANSWRESRALTI